MTPEQKREYIKRYIKERRLVGFRDSMIKTDLVKQGYPTGYLDRHLSQAGSAEFTENPIGVFDTYGHGYCLRCAHDVPHDALGEFEYDYIECEICNKSYMAARLMDRHNRNIYTFI